MSVSPIGKVVYQSGSYNMNTLKKRTVRAHELFHLVQQYGGKNQNQRETFLERVRVFGEPIYKKATLKRNTKTENSHQSFTNIFPQFR